jgi:hypothetical protein
MNNEGLDLLAFETPIVMRAYNENDSTDGSVVEFVISDESVDTHGTIFKSSGWDLDYARRNPIVSFGHPEMDSTDDTLYIGKHELRIEDKKLIAKVTFNRNNPRAVRVEKAVKGGFIQMASIRAIVDDYEIMEINGQSVVVFTKQRLYDFGILPHGSNQNAFVSKRDALIKTKTKDVDEPVVENTLERELIKNLKDKIVNIKHGKNK